MLLHLSRSLLSPCSALQGLLRKLGAMEDMMPGGMLGGMMSGGRLKVSSHRTVRPCTP